jgi:signal transduction histidine kinase
VAQASLTLNSAVSPSSVFGVIQIEAQRIIGTNRSDVHITPEAPPPPTGALIAALIGRSGRPIGHIHLTDKALGEFTEDDEAILVQLAHMAAVAVENALLCEELREGDRRKDEFLATLAHELRNPLAPNPQLAPGHAHGGGRPLSNGRQPGHDRAPGATDGTAGR